MIILLTMFQYLNEIIHKQTIYCEKLIIINALINYN